MDPNDVCMFRPQNVIQLWSNDPTCPTTGALPCYYDTDAHCQLNDCRDYTIPCQFLSCDMGATYYDMGGGPPGNCCALSSEMCMASDIRLKKGIETLKDSLTNIMKLEVVEYDWNHNLNQVEYDYFEKNNNLHTIGLIAQNVRQYYPEVVELGSNGYYRLDYTKLNSVLVEAIKEQQLFIEDIDKELEYIESKLN
jgi:hypothetical protein